MLMLHLAPSLKLQVGQRSNQVGMHAGCWLVVPKHWSIAGLIPSMVIGFLNDL